ncbi:MAG: hypothetical protein LBJ59_08405 [Zoogloeaceae bacterium]|jgi:hypothetical protein|nr:hypothetical protein [Zoogloeaceae bacterium]
MNIMPLHYITANVRRHERELRHLGLRQVKAMAAINPDAGRALQELLRSVQALAQADEFPDEEDIRTEAASLAADLRQLGKQGYRTEGLLRSLTKTADLNRSVNETA